METHPRPTRRRPRRLGEHEPWRSSRRSGRASRQAETGTTQAQPLPQQLRLAPGPGPAPARVVVTPGDGRLSCRTRLRQPRQSLGHGCKDIPQEPRLEQQPSVQPRGPVAAAVAAGERGASAEAQPLAIPRRAAATAAGRALGPARPLRDWCAPRRAVSSMTTAVPRPQLLPARLRSTVASMNGPNCCRHD